MIPDHLPGIDRARGINTTFYLGTHEVTWLAQTDVPLFISHVRLRDRKSLPRARGLWALDSGGFSELSLHGKWTVPAKDYVAAVRRYRDEIGSLQWAATQDWMCEDVMLAKTGLTIAEHQRRTVDSFLELRALAPEIHWLPTLQGWTTGCYLDCLDLYTKAGVDLRAEPVVGLGTVCRRQGTAMAERIVTSLVWEGLRLHLFGFKTKGLLAVTEALKQNAWAQNGGGAASADSMAWSVDARRSPPLPGHDKPGGGRTRGHINCANCLDWALGWRERLLAKLPGGDGPLARRAA